MKCNNPPHELSSAQRWKYRITYPIILILLDISLPRRMDVHRGVSPATAVASLVRLRCSKLNAAVVTGLIWLLRLHWGRLGTAGCTTSSARKFVIEVDGTDEAADAELSVVAELSGAENEGRRRQPWQPQAS